MHGMCVSWYYLEMVKIINLLVTSALDENKPCSKTTHEKMLFEGVRLAKLYKFIYVHFQKCIRIITHKSSNINFFIKILLNSTKVWILFNLRNTFII